MGRHRLNISGFALMEVLLSAAMVSVVALGLGSVLSDATRNQKILSEKFENLQSAVLANQALQNMALCTLIFQGQTFDASSPTTLAAATVSVNEISGGGGSFLLKIPASTASSGHKVKSIVVKNFVQGSGADNFGANLEITPLELGDRIIDKPRKIALTIDTDPLSPNTAKVVQGCVSSFGANSQSPVPRVWSCQGSGGWGASVIGGCCTVTVPLVTNKLQIFATSMVGHSEHGGAGLGVQVRGISTGFNENRVVSSSQGYTAEANFAITLSPLHSNQVFEACAYNTIGGAPFSKTSLTIMEVQ